MERDERALDAIYGALSDVTRRGLYLSLRDRPGLTTGELAEMEPRMTRWGVMKHLAVLRDAGLVQTLHDGRRRRHYADANRLSLAARWVEAAAER